MTMLTRLAKIFTPAKETGSLFKKCALYFKLLAFPAISLGLLITEEWKDKNSNKYVFFFFFFTRDPQICFSLLKHCVLKNCHVCFPLGNLGTCILGTTGGSPVDNLDVTPW